jgi:hypothetical protein
LTSALSTGALTLVDWAKRLDPNGKVPTIVELLSQTNEILDDMLWMEGNLPTGHRTTVRTGLPTVYWRLLNQGVAPSKSTTAQIDEGAGMLEAWSSVDKDLAELNGNVKAFRLSEARAYIEAMNQEMAGTMFYGNAGTAPEEFTGLAARYSSTTAGNGDNVVSAGGASTDNYSIWLIVWGENTCFGVFPKGSKAGLVHQDLGEQTVTVTAGVGGTMLRAYQDRWQWKCGLVLKDWRYVVRICNIDVSDLVALDTGSAALTKYMTKATYLVPSLNAGKAVFYMNRETAYCLDYLRRADIITGGGLTYDNVDGKRIMRFRGIPIRICDQLVTETTAVS